MILIDHKPSVFSSRMMFAGLMSRWMIFFACISQRAPISMSVRSLSLDCDMAQSDCITSFSERPVTCSITSRCTSFFLLKKLSWSLTMLGWLTRFIALASRLSRRSSSAPKRRPFSGTTILIATSCLSCLSFARTTTPEPPTPMISSSAHLPLKSFLDIARSIRTPDMTRIPSSVSSRSPFELRVGAKRGASTSLNGVSLFGSNEAVCISSISVLLSDVCADRAWYCSCRSGSAASPFT